MSDLFDTLPDQTASGPRPLADRLRPKSLNEVIGQEQVLGPITMAWAIALGSLLLIPLCHVLILVQLPMPC